MKILFDQAIVVLMTTSWPRISGNTQAVVQAIGEVQIGGFVEVRFEDA